MNKLTGLKDVDREVLKHIDDRDLLQFCSVDKRFWNEVCDDDFLRRRLGKYPGIEEYKKSNETWKQFFLRALYYIGKMKEEYEFEYIGGDFERQYFTIQGAGIWEHLLVAASRDGDLSLVKFALEKGANIHYSKDSALYEAAENDHIDIVKYLIDKGADYLTEENGIVSGAAGYGNLDVVIYLVEKGAPFGEALEWAARNGYLDVVIYLVEKGANITEKQISLSRSEGHLDVANYLQQKMREN